jgi:hypothetical protein
MIGTHASTATNAPRTSRRASKPAPDEDVRRGMGVLALIKVSVKGRKQHRYGLLAGRHRVLCELGRIAERHGDAAARTVADHLVEGLKDGSLCGSRHAAYKCRELAHRFRDARAVYGEARA